MNKVSMTAKEVENLLQSAYEEGWHDRAGDRFRNQNLPHRAWQLSVARNNFLATLYLAGQEVKK